jgi:hypothetical protein
VEQESSRASPYTNDIFLFRGIRKIWYAKTQFFRLFRHNSILELIMKYRQLFSLACTGLILFIGKKAHTNTYQVTSSADTLSSPASGTLRWAILNANQNPGSTINLSGISSSQTITLAAPLPPIFASTTINGTTSDSSITTIDGGSLYPAFFADPIINTGTAGTTVTIENFILQNLTSKGGAGGLGGGGGALGAGAGTFAYSGSLSITNVTYTNNAAKGGAGGAPTNTSAGNSGGGGGGFAGALGGNGILTSLTSNPNYGGGGGGGGFYGSGGSGGSSGSTSSGYGGGEDYLAMAEAIVCKVVVAEALLIQLLGN